MPKYIRIKKSKNLRYKLISILYLLFISLSIIQIPIDWLRISPEIRETFEAIEGDVTQSNRIELAKAEIQNTEASFSELVGLDPETGKLVQPENYSLSDNFFLKSPQGEKLFLPLLAIRDSILSLDENDPLRQKFNSLFAEDLANGLDQNSANAWLHWKFEHVPATVARLELADLKMKLNLLLGDFEVKQKDGSEEPNFILAYNIDRLHIGDTAFFVYEGERRPKLDLSVGKKDAEEYVWENDTLIFMALDTGAYHLKFSLGDEERNFHFQVLPGNFRSVESRKILAHYTGLPFQLELDDWQKDLDFRCDCMNGSRPIMQTEQLEVRPQRSGWCRISGYVKDAGGLAFKDSVYIHPLPAPILYTSGISGNEVSRSRLQRLGKVDLKVLFPNQPEDLKFEITEIKAQLHMRDSSYTKTFSEELRFSADEVKQLKYLEIQEVTVQSLDGIMTLSDRLILNIVGDEV